MVVPYQHIGKHIYWFSLLVWIVINDGKANLAITTYTDCAGKHPTSPFLVANRNSYLSERFFWDGLIERLTVIALSFMIKNAILLAIGYPRLLRLLLPKTFEIAVYAQ